MITTDFRNAAGLAAATDLVEWSAVARAEPRPPSATTLPIPAGIAPARPLAIARPPAPRTTRTARRPSAGYALAKTAATKAGSTTKASRTSSKSSATSRAKAKSSASDPLAFLKDPTLTIEDKLMKLLGYMDQRWESEMQSKMDQIAASEQAKKQESTKSSSKSSSGGFLGSVAGGIAGLIQKAATGDVAGAVAAAVKLPSMPDVVGSLVSDLGGPALAAGAAALGFPELSPALVKLGPEIGKLAKSWLSDATATGGAAKKSSGSSSGKGSSSTKSTSSSGGKVLSDSEQQMLVMDVQRIQQRQKEMFALVSDVLKGNHDARMSVINNLR